MGTIKRYGRRGLKINGLLLIGQLICDLIIQCSMCEFVVTG
jgi:hypothetical protein